MGFQCYPTNEGFQVTAKPQGGKLLVPFQISDSASRNLLIYLSLQADPGEQHLRVFEVAVTRVQ